MDTKRVFDVVLSVILLFLLSPLFLLIVILVRTTSSGPIIFSQSRIGHKGIPFVIHKFRTLFHDRANPHQGVVRKGDTCVTAAGRFLRPTHLDELPQLWNILRGDMSLVGPRPNLPGIDDINSQHIPDYQKRHQIKPGLTGLAQVSIELDKTLESHLRAFHYDCQYIKRCSFLFDLAILVWTIPVIITARGV